MSLGDASRRPGLDANGERPRSSTISGCSLGARGLKASIVQKTSQFSGARRMFQFAQRLGLDLADAFARDRELLADFLERMVGVHADAESHAQHALLARGEGSQHP